MLMQVEITLYSLLSVETHTEFQLKDVMKEQETMPILMVVNQTALLPMMVGLAQEEALPQLTLVLRPVEMDI